MQFQLYSVCFGKRFRYLTLEPQLIAHKIWPYWVLTRQIKYLPNEIWHLMKYVLKYCSESLEMLDLHSYPIFLLDKPFTKLHTFSAEGDWRGCDCDRASWRHWKTNALSLIYEHFDLIVFQKYLKIICQNWNASAWILILMTKSFHSFLFCIWIHISLIWIYVANRQWLLWPVANK